MIMPDSSNLPSLNLAGPKTTRPEDATRRLSSSTPSPATSPRSPRSSRSMPGSPFLQGTKPKIILEHVVGAHDPQSGPSDPQLDGGVSPRLTAMPEYPPSPVKASPRHGREPSKSFFSNLKASRSSNKLHSPGPSLAESSEKTGVKSRTSSKDRSLYSLRGRVSTPELPKVGLETPKPKDVAGDAASVDAGQVVSDTGETQSGSNKKPKSRLGGILGRTKSTKLEDGNRAKTRPTPLDQQALQNGKPEELPESIKTAPLQADHRQRAFADDVGSTVRNRSVDRHLGSTRDDIPAAAKRERLGSAHLFREGSTMQLLSNIHQTGRGVGDRLGKAGKGFFGKLTRSGSGSTDRDVATDETYVCTVINLPLVQQTRKTRIARLLELSMDKTEFWMPALPWRCIE